MKTFNTAGTCVPHEHYMVDLTDKYNQVKALIDARSYFTINRARQYGKTTMLSTLRRNLPKEYTPVKISFEGLGDDSFSSDSAFIQCLIRQIMKAMKWDKVDEDYISAWKNTEIQTFEAFSEHLDMVCADKKIVLMIDEVDRTSNNRVFLHFIGMLRDKYLARNDGVGNTFHSVILAGVYDIKNIKLKLINEGLYSPNEGENKVYNSPWNIAVYFEVDMSFSVLEISGMLKDYESDHHTGMDIEKIATEIRAYTDGYPFLVSRICQCIDKDPSLDWTLQGVQDAVKSILMEKNTLFDDLFKNIRNDEKLSDFIHKILFSGKSQDYIIENKFVDYGIMFGFIKNESGKIKIANRIFEIKISNYFISMAQFESENDIDVLPSDIIEDDIFNMELCITKFAEHYIEIYNDRDEKFMEREGRLLFLTYLKPLINGKGFYHIESELTDSRRMDIVVDFGAQQFIIELKIWRGQKYQEAGYEQLARYLEKKSAKEGYLLTFNFLKSGEEKRKQGWIEVSGKKIFEAVI